MGYIAMFDYKNAKVPTMQALKNSAEYDVIETSLKEMFICAFENGLGSKFFDVNVAGNPHLGTFEYIKRHLNRDGLVLLDSDTEEASTRYLYRAWKAGNCQLRGLHFLRTYLQLLYPNLGDVVQLWHEIDKPYPSALVDREQENTFLTSRIRISVDGFPNYEQDKKILNSIYSVIPARFVPEFRYEATSTSGTIFVGTRVAIHSNLSSEGKLLQNFAVRKKSTFYSSTMGQSALHLQSRGILL